MGQLEGPGLGDGLRQLDQSAIVQPAVRRALPRRPGGAEGGLSPRSWARRNAKSSAPIPAARGATAPHAATRTSAGAGPVAARVAPGRRRRRCRRPRGPWRSTAARPGRRDPEGSGPGPPPRPAAASSRRCGKSPRSGAAGSRRGCPPARSARATRSWISGVAAKASTASRNPSRRASSRSPRAAHCRSRPATSPPQSGRA